ncbi:MFS general substrate transporter [Panus rudis PR-1116 ss-1]|nr:MFS general substrate transporter [Panus rudis PR-1116 ss-1]
MIARTGVKGVYYHPATQVIMLGFVCFMCPGLYNALNGLGGGGRVDTATNSNANAVHYATFAFAAWFAGPVNNILGPRLTLLLGSFGYSLNIMAYLVVNNRPKAAPFIIAAGAIQGICAGLLWTAQGSLMLAYSTESQKGRYISIFWSIFNLGSVVGASVSFGQNFHSKANSVGNGTYIGFLVLTLIGVLIPLTMADPNKMIRTDGTQVQYPRHPSLRNAIISLWIALREDPYILLLFPMFFASNWFYTWQFNDYNSALFNIRARSLNNLLYWIAQIIGSVSIGLLLDRKRLSTHARAFSAWIVLLLMVFVVHIWAYFYQRNYTRKSVAATPTKIDISDKAYIGRLWLYIFCGLLDAMWQTTVYWLMGVMTSDPAKIAHFVGFYKSIQSAGAAGVWRADGVGLPYMNIFISTWVLLAAGLTFSLPMIYLRVETKSRRQSAQPEDDSSTW